MILRLSVLLLVASLAGCRSPKTCSPTEFWSLDKTQQVFGPMVAAANQPTPYQHGTGPRIGFFRDDGGNVWGMPIEFADDSIRVCASQSLRLQPATDMIPAGMEIIGSTNQPTGWRGGTGDVELILRATSGTLHWLSVRGAPAPECPESATYYHLLAE